MGARHRAWIEAGAVRRMGVEFFARAAIPGGADVLGGDGRAAPQGQAPAPASREVLKIIVFLIMRASEPDAA